MKKTLLLPLIFLLAMAQLKGQYYTNRNKVWVFGNHAGVNFTTGSPVAFNAGGISTDEGSASVCDEAGNLLFSTDGRAVFNNTGAAMPSGVVIVIYATWSATQAAAIVPVIGNPNQYYIFSLEQYAYSPGYSHLAYSIVDMGLAGGLGDLVSGSVGIPMAGGFSEKLTVVAGTHCDVWLLAHRLDSTSFWAYNISAAGISGPVVSAVGTFVGTAAYALGEIKASPNGRRIVAQNNYGSGAVLGTELYDFDPSTGIVSNCRLLDSTHAEYGAEFSPDNTKLYTGQFPGGIAQYDISLPTTAAIRASRTTVGATSASGRYRYPINHIKSHIMNIRLLCYILISLIAVKASSQQKSGFSGKVSNTKSMPLAGSTIYLLNTNQGTTSDNQGNFSFTDLTPGNYAVQVSSVGYATLNKDIEVGNHDNKPVNFILSDAALQLDAVLVSAQKKEEFLQKVPLSITAISEKQVKEYRLWNSKELTAIVPNLYSANSGDDRNVTSIRGIATTSYDPAVTTYIDGVNQFSLDTYIAELSDIERIEVLRGPQGTLYGRNAMGGVINIITKQPTNKMNGFIELNAGNYNQLRISSALRFPLISNRLFFGISAVYSKRDGIYTNDFNNSSFDKQNAFSGNFYIKYLASKKLAFTVNVKNQNARNNGPFPLVNGVDEAFNSPFHLNQDAPAKMIDITSNISLVATYTGKRLNFSSQSAYQYNHRYYDKPLDGDFSPIDGVTVINNYGDGWNKVKVLTQEFKFTSPSSSASKLKWTAGSYLFYQDNPSKQAIHFGKDAALVGAPDTNFSIISSTKGKSSGIAFYGQLSYAVTGKLSITGGLRYDYENKKYDVLGEYQKDPDPTPLFETRPDTSAGVNFNAFSPKLGLAYNINKYSDAFITYSRGYRTGGLTALSSDPSQPPLYPYKPEYSNNIEIGIKNNLLKNRLQLNVTAFYTHVNDAQVPTLVLPDAVTVTKNAGTLASKGIEFELASTPVRGLQVDYNFGYTDATYQNLKLAQNGSSVNLDGKKQIYTPESTSMLAVQYSYGLGEKLRLKIFARAEWMYIGKQYFDLANNIKQPDYSLFNIRFGISSRYANLVFWARNLGDKKYIAYAYDFGAIHLGDPKMIGVTLSTGF